MWIEKKILVPTDFGEQARAAEKVGVELARQYRVPVVLLHVFGAPGQTYGGADLALEADFVHSLETAARHALHDEADVLATKDVEVSTVLSEGVAWEKILSTAEMVDADLIVMGTHGRRCVARALLGSVAERVVRLAQIPVLTVRNH
jgi:nucleotide-binding universal stress UspA family protein